MQMGAGAGGDGELFAPSFSIQTSFKNQDRRQKGAIWDRSNLEYSNEDKKFPHNFCRSNDCFVKL